KNKTTLFPGRGTLKGKNVVEVKGPGAAETIEARAVILATGSEPKSLPGVAIDEKIVLSSNGAVRNERAPKSIAVIGAGAVGVEFADVYAAYGVQVTILEALPRVVPVEDEEVSKELARTFTRRGITLKTGVKVVPVKPGGVGVVVELEGEKLEVEQVLRDGGRAPSTTGTCRRAPTAVPRSPRSGSARRAPGRTAGRSRWASSRSRRAARRSRSARPRGSSR